MAEAGELTASEVALLIRAVSYLVDVPASSVTSIRPLVRAELSAVDVRRYDIEVEGALPFRVVVRPCLPAERRVQALLEGVNAVAKAHVEENSDGHSFAWVELDRADSLIGTDVRSKRLVAEALSEVHAQFLGRDAQLTDVPSMTEQYLQDVILSWCGSWTAARKERRFAVTFERWVRPVEVSASRLPADLLAFSEGLQLNTLTHTDVRRERLLDVGNRVEITGWSQARCAPLFLDLGDTFDTAASGWIYRDALAARGCVFDDDVFSRGHLLARRFAGIRYLAYWLTSWLTSPSDRNRTGLQRTLAMAAGQSEE